MNIQGLYVYIHKNVMKSYSRHALSFRLLLLINVVQCIKPQKELHILSWEFQDHSLQYTFWIFKMLRSIQGSVLLFCPLWGLCQCPKNQFYLQFKHSIIFPFCPSHHSLRGTRQLDFVLVHFTLKTSLLGQPIITIHLGQYLLIILTKRKPYRIIF